MMLGKGAFEQCNGLQPLGFHPANSSETHADSGIERAQPDAVDVLATFGQDGVEVLDTFQGLNLDYDSCLVVDAFVEGLGWVEGGV